LYQKISPQHSRNPLWFRLCWGVNPMSMSQSPLAPLLDSAVIAVFLVFTWATILYVLVQALPLATGGAIALSMIAAAGVTCLFTSAALIAVISHIWKNKPDLYP
jgi:hypothetical protein